MPSISVRWQGKKLNLDVDTDESPLVLKAQLYGLTGVAPERQKVIVKGKTLADDTWSGITLDNGATIMLMGSTEQAPAATATIATTEGSKSVHVAADTTSSPVIPCGLTNLGNTCYMNASLQCFKMIPELTDNLKLYRGNMDQRPKKVTTVVKNLYAAMDKRRMTAASAEDGDNSEVSVMPFQMMRTLHEVFPQFATVDERGTQQQQDANECFTQVLQMLAEETTINISTTAAPSSSEEMMDTTEPKNEAKQTVKLRKFLETEFESTIRCLDEEAKDEQIVKSFETQLQLSCFLSQDVRYLQSGIKSKLTEEIEKHSSMLGRNARYEKKSYITRLPAYLSIQMVRFYYKEKEKINAKILKDVKFPLILDMFDLCTPELQAKLRPNRDAIKAYEDILVEEERKSKIAAAISSSVDAQNKEKNGTDAELSQSISIVPGEFQKSSFDDDIGSNNSGYYELKAVITHKGRASNSGHYVAWVKLEGEQQNDPANFTKKKQQYQTKWAMCDDNDVYIVGEDDIIRLSGGGDYHCAYVFLYGPRKIPKLTSPDPKST